MSKVSTGYLTPQAKTRKNPASKKPHRSDSSDNVSTDSNSQLDEIFSKLMENPLKRKMVLKFLSSHKGAIKEYKEQVAKERTNSPLGKVKKKVLCESPTALYRRKALEQMEKESASSSAVNNERTESRQSELSRSESRQSEVSSGRSTPAVEFEKIMEGVVAYVEIKSKGQDRSDGAKSILRSMGATVRDQFSKDVTHVIFKDGSFKTYQKAKLMKVHMVSILWVEFSRKSQFRQKESQYPPISAENNISTVCSQMHKEYEDIIREEYRRSIAHGTALPSTQSLRNRRRTIMTASVSSNSFHSTCSKLPDELVNSQVSADKEVEEITKCKPSRNFIQTPDSDEIVVLNSPEVSDSGAEVSDSGATVNAKILNKHTKTNIFASVMRSIENIKDISSSDMELTCTDTSKSLISNVSDMRRSQVKTPKRLSVLRTSSAKSATKTKTTASPIPESLNSTNVTTDKSSDVTQVPKTHNFTHVTSRKKTKTQDKSVDVSSKSKMSNLNLSDSTEDDVPLVQNGVSTRTTTKTPDKSIDISTKSKMTSLNLSDNTDDDVPLVQILSQNGVSTRKRRSKSSDATKSLSATVLEPKSTETMSSLKLSEKSKSLSANMSSLRISDAKNNRTASTERSKSTNMSSLRFSVGKNTDKNATEKSKSTDRSKSTNMSSLRVSNGQNTDKTNAENTKSTNMSSLRVSDPKNTSKTSLNNEPSTSKRSFESDEFPLIDQNCIENALKVLESPFSGKASSSKTSLESSGGKNSKKTTPKRSIRSLYKALENLDQQISETQKEAEKEKSVEQANCSNNICNDGTCKKCSDILTDDDSEVILKTPSKPTRKLREKRVKNTEMSSSRAATDSSSGEKVSKDKKSREKLVKSRKSTVKVRKTSKEMQESNDVDNIESKNAKPLTGSQQKSSKPESSDDTDDSGKKHKKQGKLYNPCAIPTHRTDSDKKTESKKAKPFTGSQKKSPKPKCSDDTEDSGKKLRQSYKPYASSTHQTDSVKKIESKEAKPLTGAQKKSSKPESSDDTDDSSKKRKKLRKLYNPCESPTHPTDLDEEEREEKRKQALLNISNKRKSLGVILVPLFPVPSEKEQEKDDSDDIFLEFLPTTPKRKKKESGKSKDKENELQVDYNSSQDEQRDLLDEILSKKNPQTKSEFKTPSQTTTRRRSVRVATQTEKISRQRRDDSVWPITPIKRRSTLDFQPTVAKSTIKKPKINKPKLSTIVCTKLHKNDVQLFGQIVRKLGRFVVEDEVSSRTTHLVAGEPKRTINMLRAVARGCWVVRFDWVLKSLEAERWLPEEDFEETDFGAVVQKARIERQAFGPGYTLDVFENCGPIFIARNTNPRCSDLQELVALCKGNVVTSIRMAKIVIGDYVEDEEVTCLNEKWVLDCITMNKKVSFHSKYRIEKPAGSGRGRLSVAV